MALIDDIINGARKNVLNPVGNAAINTLNNSIVNPIKRSIELVNPNSDTSKGYALAAQSANKYGYTPSFLDTVAQAYPSVKPNLNDAQTSLKNGAVAGGINISGSNPNDIQISNQSRNQAQTLLHEGLHQSYKSLSNEQKTLYDKLVDQSLQQLPTQYSGGTNVGDTQTVTKLGLGSYLQSRLHSYEGYNGGPITNVESLPQDIQNEVHSYTPEYFQDTNTPYTQGLGQYYANYFNTGQKATPVQKKNQVQSFFDQLFAPVSK